MMRTVFICLGLLASALAGGLWFVLINFPPAELTGFGDELASAMYFSALLAALGGGAVALLDERCGLRFFGAVSAVAALLALAAFHSTFNSRRIGVRVRVGAPLEQRALQQELCGHGIARAGFFGVWAV